MIVDSLPKMTGVLYPANAEETGRFVVQILTLEIVDQIEQFPLGASDHLNVPTEAKRP